jgi:hypothetical protein
MERCRQAERLHSGTAEAHVVRQKSSYALRHGRELDSFCGVLLRGFPGVTAESVCCSSIDETAGRWRGGAPVLAQASRSSYVDKTGGGLRRGKAITADCQS